MTSPWQAFFTNQTEDAHNSLGHTMLDHKTTTYGSLPHGKRFRRQAPTKINGAHLLTLFCVPDCTDAAHVQPAAPTLSRVSSTSANVLQIELVVNEKPAVAAMRFVAEETPKYHIVAFDQRTQDFSHLVHAGGRSYRFTSTNGGYAPSGNETIGCAVESSRESAQETGGPPNAFTVSQLSQQARARLPSGTPPTSTCMHTHGRGSASRDPWLAAVRRLPGHLGDGGEAAPER